MTSKYGEIDLIMQEKHCIVFVEVRYRKNNHFGCAEMTIDHQKQKRIITTALEWMNKQKINSEMQEFRFDVVAFTGNTHRWIKNAF